MRYLCLIYDDERSLQEMSASKMDALMREYRDFTHDARASGHFVAGEQLQPVHTATTLRQRQGRLATLDGPSAETKEHLGGFYLIDARDLNEALQVAARIPSVRTGSIEVRPVVRVTG